MKRMSSRVLITALAATLPGCGDEDFVCQLDVCGTGCVNVNDDPLHCGSCFNECDTGEACMAGACTPTELVCTAPEVVCGDECADTQTSNAHCGTCDAPCTTNGTCFEGGCAEPLVAMRTVFESKGDLDRDVFVLTGRTFELGRLGNTTFGSSRVIDFSILPDGRVLLVAAQETEGVFELFLSAPGGGALTKLSGTLVTGGNVVEGVAISADGTKVLYRADQDVDDQFDLYAVSVANPGVTVKVNEALVTGGRVSRVFSLSMDGSRATFIADLDQLGVDELYTVDLSQATPGASVKLNPTIGNTDADVFDFVATADHSRVLYRSNETLNVTPQLFVADVATAGTAKRVTNSIEPDYNASHDYSLSADGASVIYIGGEGSFEDEMWTSALDVATPDSALLAANLNGFTSQIRTAKAVVGGAVFFRQDIDFGATRLFTVNVATPNVISPVFDPNLGHGTDRIVVSPNGQHLVFGAAGDGGESGIDFRGTDGPNPFGRSFELYHVDLAQTFPVVPTRIAQITQSGHDGIEHDFIVRDDGSVIFRADLDTTGTTEVYVGHPSTPDTVLKISPPLDRTTDATDVRQIKSF